MTDELNSIYWTVEEIRPYIINYLKKEFPDSIIKREFDKVDIMILGPNIPVEIQRTRTVNNNVCIAQFENEIRKQIEQNIEIYEQCWFFFDEKFLRYLNSGELNIWSSINMDWLYKFHKSEKIKVFTISNNGIITKLKDEDFKFIFKYSSTCKLSSEEDYRILEKNKSKIAYNIFKGYKFTTDEINNWYDEYEHSHIEDIRFYKWLSIKGERKKTFAKVLFAIGHLNDINDMFKCVLKNNSRISTSSDIELIEGNGRNKYIKIKFIDKFDISKYFPGYFEKKEFWDYMKTHTISHNEFIATVRGEFDYLGFYKNQKSLEDY